MNLVRMVASLTMLCVASLVPEAAPAQVAYDSPNGRVEVLGLRRWTLSMLQDSIRHYVRGQELYEAACMVTLRDSLHFAEASVERFEMAPPGQPPRSFLAIKVIEPEQAASVQWDTVPRNEFSSLLPDYAPLALAITDSLGAVWRGRLLYWLQFAEGVARERAMTSATDGRRADANRLFSFLAAHHTDADRARAMRTLANDGFWVNRMIAIAVLSSFAANDSTWFVLVHSLRDPHEAVREAAGSALHALPSRPIDWHVSVSDLRLLLGGTNLPAIQSTFELLARTNVAPSLASPLLKNNAAWLLDHLGSEAPMASEAAHGLLVRLNAGRDLGQSRSSWEPWIRSL